ncbi:MAG: amidase domain-containing protein [Clostridia bacterium]|nr:amidase domain-containing protein [Clostridia bacterium]MBQ8792968.1 amidase domain-containing protein [Clostridia bacterium]
MKPYDRLSALHYARQFALSPNPNYYHFAGIGGDCTNYISQCLLAGGGVMCYTPNGWYYNSSSDRSPSWTSVNELQKFLLNESLSGPKAEISTLKDLQIGDIIQLRQNPTHFNHTVIVSKITNQDIYVCAHSNDALDRKLSSYNYFELLPLHITRAN